MDPNLKAMFFNIGGRFWDYALNRLTTGGGNPVEKRIEQLDKVIQSLPADGGELTETPSSGPEPPQNAPERQSPTSISSPTATAPITLSSRGEEEVATACVPCALGHFSRSAGALNEAVRFKNEGITSNEILDRIACVLEEQNTLERFDLTPEKLQRTPQWEREIAEEALQQSRKLRHRLEGIETVEQLGQAAAETATFYKKMNRQWYRGRFSHLGGEKAEAISQRVGSEDMEA